MPMGATGHVRAPHKNHLMALSARKHRGLMASLMAMAPPPSFDCRDKGWLGPIKNQASCGSCFPAGTLVRMADGSHKPIEQVSTTDSVLTAEGNVKRVTHTMRRHADEPLLTLVAWGHYHLRATAEHPIYTKRGYVKLSEVQPGDWVGFPRYAPETTKVIQTADYVFGRNHGKNAIHAHRNWSEERHYEYAASLPGRKVGMVTAKAMPDVVHLTEGFGRLAGLYLAEGSTSRGKVTWTFNARERDTFAAEVVSLLKSEFGVDAKLAERPNNVVNVVLYGARFPMLFEALFAQGAGSKRLHPDLASGPKDFLRGVLTGWMDGDKQKDGAAVSISRRLALGMFDIANAVGMMPSLSTHQKGKVGKDGIRREHAWRVGINDPQAYKRGAASQDDTHMWRKVCEVTEEPFVGDVFNLEVEDDHSYTAEGMGVHNCWDFSGTCLVESAYYVAGVHPNDGTMALSEQYTLSCGQNGGCNGDDNTNVLEWAKKTGLPLVKDYGSYAGRAGQCAFQPAMTLYKIDDWGFCDPNAGQSYEAVTPADLIKAAMMKYGPIGCAVAAGGSQFWDDGKGVGTGTSRGINHDVVLAGWDDSKGPGGAWIMRNSWGPGWGECLAGDTRVPLLSGDDKAISDLASSPEAFWVYAYDHQRAKVVPALATAKQTGFRDDLVRVTLDNGESVLCTGDHLWMARDGNYRKAEELRSGDSLMPLYRSQKKGYEKILQPNGHWDVTHWRVVHDLNIRRDASVAHACDDPKCKLVVHHKDFNGLNNAPDNLEVMFHCEHVSLHALLGKSGAEAIKAWWAVPENREKHLPKSIKAITEYNEKLRAGVVAITEAQIDARRGNVKVATDASAKKIGECGQTDSQRRASLANIAKAIRMDEESKEKHRQAMLKNHGVSFPGQMPVTEKQKDARRENMRKLNRERASRRQPQPVNHKVVTVETVHLAIPVYDLVVKDHHNFAISAGVFVHNSGYGWIAYGADGIGTEAVWARINASAPPIDYFV